MEVARALIEAGLTPPMVHLTADVGQLTLYDASMIHRGGQNRSDAERPILAVHINKEKRELRHQRKQQQQQAAAGGKPRPAASIPVAQMPATIRSKKPKLKKKGKKKKAKSDAPVRRGFS